MFFYFYILQWKKNQKDSADFWHRKMTLKTRIMLYWTFHSKSIQIPKKIFMVVFIDLWPYLFTNKFCSGKLFKWGHSKAQQFSQISVTQKSYLIYKAKPSHGRKSQFFKITLITIKDHPNTVWDHTTYTL